MELEIIAHIRTDFPTKFGIPRQSGLCKNISTVVFEKKYRNDEALRGIEQFSHLWLIWSFSMVKEDIHSLTVRPPRLGGNKRMGVFATRSPYRPNKMGLSSVRLKSVEKTEEGSVLIVEGADLADGTPIYDIKPYLPFTDSHPDAVGGFSDEKLSYSLSVDFPPEYIGKIPKDKREVLLELLSQDPRPQYIDDCERVFGFYFADCEIKFKVSGEKLTVVGVETSSDAGICI